MKRVQRVALACLSMSAVAAVLVPIPSLPAPTGPYPVGTQYYFLTDRHRREIFSRNPDEQRQLMIQVWYPSDRTDTNRLAPYMQKFSELSPLLVSAPIFAVLASHLPLIPTHSTMSAPVATDTHGYPVLIFSHGVMGGRIQNTVLAEELASHGYVVAGIDHTFDCSFAIFPHKTVCSLLMTQMPHPSVLMSGAGFDERVTDISFVLDELARINTDDPTHILTGRLDMTRVGIYGHSLGGQTAMHACEKDSRIKAGLSMDGVSTDISHISQPIMLMQADRPGDPFGLRDLCRRFIGPYYILTLAKSGHVNFTDLPLLTPVHWLICLSGSIDGLRATKIIDSYVLQFFDCYLKEEKAPLLEETTASYPEVLLLKSARKL